MLWCGVLVPALLLATPVSLCPGTGGLRLLSPGSLASLLQLLSERDMPVDMLQLLVSMAEDGCRWGNREDALGFVHMQAYSCMQS